MNDLFLELTKSEPSLHSKFYELKKKYKFQCTSYRCSGLKNDLALKSSIVKKYNKYVGEGDSKKKIEKKFYNGLVCNRCGAIFNPFSWTGFEGMRSLTDFLKFIHFALAEHQIFEEDDVHIFRKFREVYNKALTQRKLDSYREMLLTFLNLYGYAITRNGKGNAFGLRKYLSSTPSGQLLNFVTYYNFGITPVLFKNKRLGFEEYELYCSERNQFAINKNQFCEIGNNSNFNNIVSILKKSTGQKFYRFTKNDNYLIVPDKELSYFEESFLMIDNVNTSIENKVLLNATLEQLNLNNIFPGFDELFYFTFLNGTWVRRSAQKKQPLKKLRLPPVYLPDFRGHLNS